MSFGGYFDITLRILLNFWVHLSDLVKYFLFLNKLCSIFRDFIRRLLLFFSVLSIDNLLFDDFDDFLANMFLSLFFTFPLLVNKRIKPIFNHMLSTGLIKNRNNFTPSLPIFQNKFKDTQIFSRTPFSSFLLVVEMIQPSFSAVFWRFKNLEVGIIKNSLSNLIPSSIFLLLNCL